MPTLLGAKWVKWREFWEEGATFSHNGGGPRGPREGQGSSLLVFQRFRKWPMWFQSLQRKTVLEDWDNHRNDILVIHSSTSPKRCETGTKELKWFMGISLPRPCLWKTEKGLDERMNKAFGRESLERWASERCSMGDEIQQRPCGVQARRCLLCYEEQKKENSLNATCHHM